MESVRPSIFTYIALMAIGIPFLGSIVLSQGSSGTSAPLPLISIFIFGYKPSMHFMHSSFLNFLTWIDYAFCILLITMPFEFFVQNFRLKQANKKAKNLETNDFQAISESNKFTLWLRPFSLDKRVSIYSIPEIPHSVYVSFSDRNRSIPIFPSEVNLYDMFRSFTDYDMIHISEGDNNLPGGGGLSYGDEEWQSKVELAINNAEIIIFQPFNTFAMDFEINLIKKLKKSNDIIYFFPVFETSYCDESFLRKKMKKVEQLKYYPIKNYKEEIEDINQSIIEFCENNKLSHPGELPFPALIRYDESGEISGICSLYWDRKSIKEFFSNTYEVK